MSCSGSLGLCVSFSVLPPSTPFDSGFFGDCVIGKDGLMGILYESA